jgi:flagellar biosynthesis/type III secretory pathway protein FliH
MAFKVVSALTNSTPFATKPTAIPIYDEAEVIRRVQQEVNRLRGQAEAEARTKGEAEGRALLAPELAAMRSAVSVLTNAAAQLAHPLAEKETELADLVTEMGFLLARHIIGREVSLNPASLLAIVRKLIEEATAEKSPRQKLILKVSPADYQHILKDLGTEDVEIRQDATVTKGGALVEVASPDDDPINIIEWDATLKSRMENMRTALLVSPEFRNLAE